jgi:hypothetical protein
MDIRKRNVGAAQNGIGRDALARQHVEHRAELGRLVDLVVGADAQDVAARDQEFLRSRGWLQLNQPFL